MASGVKARAYDGLVLTLRSTIRPGDDDGQRRDITATGPDYQTALEQLVAQVPDGWIRLHVVTGEA